MLKRFLILLAVVGIAAAAPYALPRLHNQVGLLPVAQTATSPAAELRLACPGGLYQTGGTSGTSLSKIVHSGAAKIYSIGASPKKVKTSKFEVIAKRQDSPEIVQDSNWMTALQLQLASTESLGGLAATSCLQARTDSTLIGGDTTTGHETLLTVVNPGKVDSSVRVIAYGPAGRLGGQALTELAVSASTAQVISLNGLIPDAPTFSIRVIANGPGVAAFLQQRTVHGTKPAGLDWVQASPSEPATRGSIPGILVRGAPDAVALKKQSSAYSDIQMVLRVNNHGNRATKFTVQIFGEGGTSFGTVLQGSVSGQSTIDLPITGLKDGDYSAQLRSDLPISTSVLLFRVHGATAPVVDFSWLQQVPAITSGSIAVANSGISKISFVNSAATSASVLVRFGGTTKTLNIAAGAQSTVQVDQGSRVSFEASVPVAASMVIDVDGALADVPLINQGNQPVTTSVTVR
ncbi:MAG: hypothetical protein RLZZ626_18 [Actinomycetota bacterium]|jgi:hypothetical protein